MAGYLHKTASLPFAGIIQIRFQGSSLKEISVGATPLVKGTALDNFSTKSRGIPTSGFYSPWLATAFK